MVVTSYKEARRRMTTDQQRPRVEIQGVWLQAIGGGVKVLVQVDGLWVVVIHETILVGEESLVCAPISHVVEPSGILSAYKEERAHREMVDEAHNVR